MEKLKLSFVLNETHKLKMLLVP